jgi:hypothetical protein
MDLRLVTLKAVFFYLLYNVSTITPRRKLSYVTVVCKHFASYQGYPNYRWDLKSGTDVRLRAMKEHVVMRRARPALCCTNSSCDVTMRLFGASLGGARRWTASCVLIAQRA